MSDAAAGRSPYEAVLGNALNGLHPQLVSYFAAIPTGHHGRGSGSFERVGTPRRWLWPLFWAMQSQGVLFPGWHQNVPFTVTNIPGRDSAGQTTVRAIRRFEFDNGPRSMIDAITAFESASKTRLVDFLGRDSIIECALAATVTDGALRMHSTGVAIAVGRLRFRIPDALAPRVTLIERFDDGDGSQHVSVELSSPLLGKIYEYAGAFRYEIRPGNGDE